MLHAQALLGFVAISSLLLPASVLTAESYLEYIKPIPTACTRRPLTSAEHAYFARYNTLRQTLPPTPAGWQAQDLSWIPPAQECVQKNMANYILAADVHYDRLPSAAEQTKMQAISGSESPHKAELDQLKAREQALFAREDAIRKGNAALTEAVQKEFMKAIALGNQVALNMTTSDLGKLAKMRADANAENAKYKQMQAKLDKAQAPLDALQKQRSAIESQEKLLVNQERVASYSRRHDILEDHSARVFVQLNVHSKNLIRMRNTPLQPSSMNNTFALCIHPQKMHVPGALYAWRCSNEDQYNDAANLEERRGAMIVAIFAKSKADAPTLQYVDGRYYDHNFKPVEGKSDLLYIRGARLALPGCLESRTSWSLFNPTIWQGWNSYSAA